MLTDKHRTKRKRIHWQANPFTKCVCRARHKTQFVPVGVSKSLLVVVFGVVFGRQFRDHHRPLGFDLQGRQFAVLAIHEHVIKQRVDEHPFRRHRIVKTVEINFQGDVTAPHAIDLLLHHATIVAHFGEESAGKERIHATGAAAGKERFHVIIGVVEFAQTPDEPSALSEKDLYIQFLEKRIFELSKKLESSQ